MKSTLENQEVLKLPLFAIFKSLVFLVGFSIQKVQKFKKSKSIASKCVKMVDFALLESLKLISRKIWVIEKSRNFHTVEMVHRFFRKFPRFDQNWPKGCQNWSKIDNFLLFPISCREKCHFTCKFLPKEYQDWSKVWEFCLWI